MGRLVPKGLSRTNLTNNLSTTNLILNAAAGPTDPIQQLYADKVVQYGSKKKESASIFVDGTKQDEDALKEDLDKIAETYGGGKGVDMLSFPAFKFKEPAIDTTDTLSEEIFFVKGKTEADQIRNETMKLKSQVDQLSQERDELILKMEEEESVASLALHELQSANDNLVAEIQSLHSNSNEMKEKNKAEIDAITLVLNETKSSLANSIERATTFEAEKEELVKKLAQAIEESAKMEIELEGKAQ